MLHGFPENHYSWRYQIEALSLRFKVVAPDLRGYNLTKRKEPYDILALCADVMGLIRAFGREKAVVAGHDWGAIILWSFALEYPEALSGLVALNVSFVARGPRPPLEVLTDSRFDYIRFFQKPGEAEAVIEAESTASSAERSSTMRRARLSSRTRSSRSSLTAFAGQAG